ncbi:hypothetical protein A3N57_16210 [Enterobacter cloacae subsp. dissolvens]|uniref:hypothetical protein n=1 Tax=Enterobacter cloacae TaxID=550 RepID=UPI0007B3475A|nr:hypothetical protein [Enterobacter cloacae]KZQ32280.1 hypothetical protein A3N57_16210 [Enterobacter cloacae subsp. dissolvens]
MNILNLLNFGWVGSLIGIVSLLFAAFVYIKSVKKAEPCYQWRTNTIIGDINDDISSKIHITFDSIDINNLKRTLVVFWNNGKEYIDRDLILSEHPLSISFNDGDILSHQIKSTNNNSIVASTSLKNKNIIIDFNCLNRDNALCVEILHTSSDLEPIITGTIKGVDNGVLNKGIIQLESFSTKSKLAKYIIPALGLILIISGVISLYFGDFSNLNKISTFGRIIEWNNKLEASIKEYHIQSWSLMFIGIFYIMLSLLPKVFLRNKTPKNIDLN